MKKIIIFTLVFVTLLTSFVSPKKFSKNAHFSNPKKVNCSTSFNFNVTCYGGNVRVLYIEVVGVVTYSPYASCNSSGYLGSAAFTNGTYTVRVTLDAPGGLITDGSGSISSTYSGILLTWPSVESATDYTTITLNNVSLTGCGESYYVNVHGG